MHLPQSKLNDILQQISEKINFREQFSDWDAAIVKREIKALPTYVEREQALGLFYASMYNKPLAIKAFNNALSSNKAHISTIENYITALSTLRMYNDSVDKAHMYAQKYSAVSLYRRLLPLSIIHLDLALFEESVSALKKMDKFDETSVTKALQVEADILQSIPISGQETLLTHLKDIGTLVNKLAEVLNVEVIGNAITHEHANELVSINYKINASSCNSEQLSELNLRLIDQLIDKNLDQTPLTVRFSRISHSESIYLINKFKEEDVS